MRELQRARAVSTLPRLQAAVFTAVCAIWATESSAQDEFMSVTTAAGFQNVVRAGVPHVVINAHIDMVDTPRFSGTTRMDDGMIAITKNATTGEYTRSIRGNCSDARPPEFVLTPQRRLSSQCMVRVREDFLETEVQESSIWVSELYVVVAPGRKKKEGTLVGAFRGDFYLTNMDFVGDGEKVRALDAKEHQRIYASRFSKDRDTVIRLQPGTLATIVNSNFQKNIASTNDREKVAAGPIAGLKDDATSEPPAIWFQDCTFEELTSEKGAEVAIESRRCLVFSNTQQPTVYNRKEDTIVNSWRLTMLPQGQSNVQDAFDGLQFPTESDAVFQRIVENSAVSGLPVYMRTLLPPGTVFTLSDPYSSDKDSQTLLISIIATVVALILLCVIGLLFYYFCCVRPKKQCKTKESSAPSQRRASSTPRVHSVNVPPSQPRSQEDYASERRVSNLRIAKKRSSPSIPSSRFGPFRGEPYGSPLTSNTSARPAQPSTPPPRSSSTSDRNPISTFDLQSSPGIDSALQAVPSDTSLQSFNQGARGHVPGLFATTSQQSKTSGNYNYENSSIKETDDDLFPPLSLYSGVAKPPAAPAQTPPQDPNPNPNQNPISPLFLPTNRGPERAATYIFDTTVVPDTDDADRTHEDVMQQLRTVYTANVLYLNKYELLGPVHQRLGGTGVTQFAKAIRSSDDGWRDIALKFYIKRAAFDRIAVLYTNPSAKACMSAVSLFAANNDHQVTAGCVLPPCVVMKRGENLEEWVTRVRPNFPTAVNALCMIAEQVARFHAAGFVYYALKPSNIAWFSAEKEWKLIDFSCAARKGTRACLSFTLNYAAPEVVRTEEAGESTIPVDPAADVWALGVLAVELILQQRTFMPGTPVAEIRNKITGRLPLPWEENEPLQLRTMRHSAMSCLERNPRSRASAAEVHRAWLNLLDFAAVPSTSTKSRTSKPKASSRPSTN